MASPLILLGPGIAIGFLPMVGSVAVEPQIVPEVILPPLLFGAAVAMPVMDVRRELPAVAGLAGGLVLVSAMVLGAIIHVMVPEVSPAWTIALGAVLGHRRGPHDRLSCPGAERPGPGLRRRPFRGAAASRLRR